MYDDQIGCDEDPFDDDEIDEVFDDDYIDDHPELEFRDGRLVGPGPHNDMDVIRIEFTHALKYIDTLGIPVSGSLTNRIKQIVEHFQSEFESAHSHIPTTEGDPR